VVDEDSGGAQAQPEPVKKKEDDAALTPKRITKTWVEFVVLDMEGNPAVGQHYLIMLPDGSLHEGKIGKNGNVRFEGIYPENSVFTLPELDQEAWERAG